MNYASVARMLASLFLILASLALLPAFIAALNSETAQLFAFLTLALMIGVLSLTVLLLTPKPARRAVPSDALAVLVLWWILIPLVAGFPFVLGTANSSILSGIHEAASCVTTTGYSVINIGEGGWPNSLIAWRAILHIIGAIATMVTAASLFAAINLGGPGIHRTVLFKIPEQSFFDTLPHIARTVTVMFGVSLLASVGALLLTGYPIRESVTLAISALTTGLVRPDAIGAAAPPPFTSIIAGITLLFGTLGLVVMLPFRDRRIGDLIRDPEAHMMLFLLACFTLLAFIMGSSVMDGLAWSLSALSTSGIALTDADLGAKLPLPIIVLPAIIGGSALSAAGGIKLARIVILTRRAVQEFRHLGFRRSIVHFKFRGRPQAETTIIGVWVYLVAYIVTLFVFFCGFAFFGADFEDALRTSVGTLTNSGAMVGIQGPDLTPANSILMIASMLLGRFEIIALIPALMPDFWRN